MLKKFFSVIVALALTIPALADGRIIPESQLPDGAKAFISKYFESNKVLQAEIDDFEYEVLLEGGIKLEFDNKGNWTKVDCEHSDAGVPAAIIPAKVAEYLNASYKDSTVTSITKERRTIEVELDDYLELIFNSEGKFLRIDD